MHFLKKQYCYIITLINDDANNDNEGLPDYQITGLLITDHRITRSPITRSPDYQITRLKKKNLNIEQNKDTTSKIHATEYQQIQISFHIHATE